MKTTLPSREDLIKDGYPYGKAANEIPLGDPNLEYLRTDPDYIVYRPFREDLADRDNEHFIVFPAPSGEKLIAIWTQSSVEGRGDNHIVISDSKDAVTWSTPRILMGALPGSKNIQCACAFPIVTDRGRIYLFGTYGNGTNGEVMCIYSDDEGATFSFPTLLELPDHGKKGGLWIVWQKPEKFSDGSYLAGCTISFGKSLTEGNWCHTESRSYILAFENLDDHPEPEEIRLSWRNEYPITVTDPMFPSISVAQEPALAELPDGRLWVQMRTMCDQPYFCLSSDGGRTFTEPKPMHYSDSTPILHPLSPCPIYSHESGKYFILVHQNNGCRLNFDHHDLKWTANYSNFIRNPSYLCKAVFSPKDDQPLRIDPPKLFADTGDIAVGPKMTAEAATYTSYTLYQGKHILWYPDRKFYLLGKNLDFLL